MSDLISRSALINKIRGIVPSSQDVDFIVGLIEEQPTAYDAEMVVAEIKRDSKNAVEAGMCPSGFVHCLTAIDAVRKGGVE
jgi:hypothetical protein